MRRKRWKLVSLLVLAGLVLCIGAVATKQTAEQEKAVSIDQVPEAVKATIFAEAKGGTIGEIEMETENGQTAYEAEVTIDGQKVEIKVADDGKLLGKEADDEDGDDEDEEQVSIDQVPAAVKDTILAQGGTVKEIERENENGQAVYEADVIIDGQKIEVKVADDGKLLGKEADDEDDDKDDGEDK